MDFKDWLGEDNQLGLDIIEKKYRYNGESFDQFIERVSAGDQKLAKLIREKKFLFGGRVLSNRGVPGGGNYYNCFSAGYVPDDYVGIMDTLKEVGITFKIQGGQGISMTQLRPKGTPIGQHYASDGIMPFIEMFNTVTQGTSQGGSRKGALLIGLDIRHKEAEAFIKLKTDLDAVTKANLSLEIDDEFMKAVQDYYTLGEVVTLHECRNYNGHLVEYDIVPIELYKLMMQVVYDYGEPGCIFTNNFRNYNFLEHDDRYNIEICNPCGEQPLKAKTCCNLGSLNLYEFVQNKFTKDARFDWSGFADAIAVACNALDEIIDENADRLPEEMAEYRQNAKDWRNIGLGVFGYAYMLIAMGMKYGSEKAIDFTDRLFEFMMATALNSNAERGQQKGAYPMYDAKLFTKSKIFEYHKGEYAHFLDPDYPKMRNCSLLSIAPCGTIATMLLGGSTGIEPEFAFSYTRKTDNLKESYAVESKIICDYRAATGNMGELPSYFITSAEIPWDARIETQSAIQKHIDTAISSTVNLPEEATLESIEQLYLYAWQCGLKGITIFRSGCKRAAILSTNTKKEDKPIEPEVKGLERGYVIPASDDLIGLKRGLTTGCGSLHLAAFFDRETLELRETYLAKGSTGGCINSLTGLSRMISLSARAGVPFEQIIDQLDSCGACASYATRKATKGDTSPGSCCPAAVGRALKDMYDSLHTVEQPKVKVKPVAVKQMSGTAKCPQCGEPLLHEGGCDICKNCGYSKCD